jgi:hypothetical protein
MGDKSPKDRDKKKKQKQPNVAAPQEVVEKNPSEEKGKTGKK